MEQVPSGSDPNNADLNPNRDEVESLLKRVEIDTELSENKPVDALREFEIGRSNSNAERDLQALMNIAERKIPRLATAFDLAPNALRAHTKLLTEMILRSLDDRMDEYFAKKDEAPELYEVAFTLREKLKMLYRHYYPEGIDASRGDKL